MDSQKKMKVRLVAALVTMVALCAGLGTGCTTTVTPEKRAEIRAEVADVMRFAYEVGGRAAYSNYVERMVADGKLTPERAEQLHVISQEVFDRLVGKLDGGCTDGDCPDGNCNPKGGECADGQCPTGQCTDCTVK